jgi:hypothetical protein
MQKMYTIKKYKVYILIGFIMQRHYQIIYILLHFNLKPISIQQNHTDKLSVCSNMVNQASNLVEYKGIWTESLEHKLHLPPTIIS